jgi:outer membrane protein assembly factor BamE (lipoprotein component of BamABCDE complex)
MNPHGWNQIVAVLRLEIRKSFLSRRGLWIYLLAAIPVAVFAGHYFVTKFRERNENALKTPGVTSEMMARVKTGMTREEVRALLPEPSRQFNFERREHHFENLTWGDGQRTLTVTLEDGKVTRVRDRFNGADKNEDIGIFAGMFQFFYLRLGIFFGCVFVFMNLFRGEMLDKTLHYYFLAPVRREVLLAGKFLAGLIATTVIFCASTIVQLAFLYNTWPEAARSEHLAGPGWAQAATYVGVTALACVGYGAVFLAAGVLIRNPLIPAALVLLWESINGILPAVLRKFSVIYYLKSMCPVEVPMDKNVPPPLAMLALNVDPASPVLAVGGLMLVAALVLVVAGRRVRKLEINYGADL